MYTIQAFAEGTLTAILAAGANSATLNSGHTFQDATKIMLVIEPDVTARREIVEATISSDSITSIIRAKDNTSDVEHPADSKVWGIFAPSNYTAVTDFVGARATLASTLGTTVASTYTKIALDTETYDVGGNFADGKFVAPVNGYYQISGLVAFTNITDADKRFRVCIYKNGGLVTLAGTTNGGDTDARPSITDTLYLAATDYIELYYYHTGATTVDISSTVTSLTVTLIKEV